MNRNLLISFLLFTSLAIAQGQNVDTIDLRGLNNEFAIDDALLNVSDGNVLLLERGFTYEIGSEGINLGLKFVSEKGEGEMATIHISNNFWMGDSVVTDSLVFENVNLIGDGETKGYVFNSGNKHYIGSVIFRGCNIQKTGGIWRGKASEALIENFVIDNCILDSIGEYGLITVKSEDSIANISLTNSTIANSQALFRIDGSSVSTVIRNATINQCPLAGWPNSFLDFGGSPGDLEITNVIIGPGRGGAVNGLEYNGEGNVTVTNSFFTSDYEDVAESRIPDMTAYTGASTDLWVDPDNFDFTLKDPDFAGLGTVGDPRWYPARLAGLSLSVGELSPAFDPEIFVYSVIIPEGTSAVVISATPRHESASITGHGVVDLSNGSTSSTISVTEGEIVQNYTIELDIASGIEDNIHNDIIRMYYNSISQNVVIEPSPGNSVSRVEIYNISGALIKVSTFNNSKEDIYKVDASMLKRGVFIIRTYSTNGDSKSLRIIK